MQAENNSNQKQQPTVHLMVGFMGFGKTTVARKLAAQIPAVCLTHDEFMVKLYGRNMPDEPLNEFEGRCIAVVHRLDDDDDKLIVVPEAYDLADEQIEEEIAFQEKWFKHVLIRDFDDE